MNLTRRSTRRPDEWSSVHVRARTDLAEALDGPLDPGEAAWLEGHLATCDACRDVADEYATQRLELHALRDHLPQPPRDLWARTAAAIEHESRFRDGSARRAGAGRRLLAPSALLASALVVAVAVGTLISSQRPGDGGATRSAVALASSQPTPPLIAAGPTPIAVNREMEYVVKNSSGTFTIKTKKIDEVCPSDSTKGCDATEPSEEHAVNLDQDTSTVFGSVDEQRLIVMNPATSKDGGSVSVISLRSAAPTATPSPTQAPSVPPSATASSGAASSPPTATPSSPPTKAPASPSAEPTASVEVTPSPSGSIEIATDVAVVGQSAAYSRSGAWFAFTARPIDGSSGPDIYLWKVGDAKAKRVTDDHRSVFGSWTGDVVVGSTAVDANGDQLDVTSFLLNPDSKTTTTVAQVGRAWRPSVDPTGRKAVYWSGTVRATAEPGFAPGQGTLVLGDWGVGQVQNDSAGHAATAPAGDQSAARHEKSIADGPIADWDARWDGEGTHLAIWIADANDPSIGKLSLYSVDSFDGKIDLKRPLLDAAPAAAGFAISDGKLVWADPTSAAADTGKVRLLAWTKDGVGTAPVETVTGPAIVIR